MKPTVYAAVIQKRENREKNYPKRFLVGHWTR